MDTGLVPVVDSMSLAYSRGQKKVQKILYGTVPYGVTVRYGYGTGAVLFCVCFDEQVR